jgi:phosphatidate cytidylyltransferase
VWFGFPWIDLVAAIVAPIMIGEWLRLTRGRPLARGASCSTRSRRAGAAVAAPPAGFGRETILWILACVWATDIGAYFIGSYAGGAKLAPRSARARPGRAGRRHAALGGRSAACGLAFDAGETLMLALAGIGIAWSPRPATCWNRRPSAAPA